ncbi:MAG: hypothetical protein KatS3mg129_1956 [Leptospiraceae bacterium]|nr:MAG: hypothetical protein KatS3mg129_1956 [Leptospiraceae bacterium]
MIWYTTNDEGVLIAEPEKDWILSRWDKDIMILDQTILNLVKLIQNNK